MLFQMTFFSTPNKTFKSTTLIRTTNESVYSFTYICFSGEVLSPLKKKTTKKNKQSYWSISPVWRQPPFEAESLTLVYLTALVKSGASA